MNPHPTIRTLYGARARRLAARSLAGTLPGRVAGLVASLVLGLVSVGFISFTLFTSNPFDRALPAPRA